MNKYCIVILLLFTCSAQAKKVIFSPLAGAHRLMKIFYQNCQSTKIRPYNFKKLGELNGFETKFNPKTNGRISIIKDLQNNQLLKYLKCNSPQINAYQTYLCQNPPSYLWDGKGLVNKNLIDIFHNEKEVEVMAHHPGLDCSGFINLSFILEGLKVDTSIPTLDSANEISAKDFMRPLSCFKNISIENGDKVIPGDVIAWNKHIVMIDTVSDDPFGIKKIKSSEGCNLLKLNPNYAKMIVINSKGSNDPESALKLELVNYNSPLKDFLQIDQQKLTGVGPGITRLYFNQLTLTYPIEIMEMIQTACLAKFKIKLIPRKWKIVRHVLADKKYSFVQLERCSIKKNEQPVFVGNDLVCR